MADLPQPPRPRRRAQRAGRPRTLDREAIVDAALRVLDADGLDAVTIRRIAEELGTSGTALYTYVSDKDELIGLLVDRVIGEADITSIDADLPWQDQLRLIGREMRRVFGMHRDIARATLGSIPRGEHSLVAMEAMIGRLRAAGVPDPVISFGTDMIALYTAAIAYEESKWKPDVATEEQMIGLVAELRAYFTALPRERFPNIVALAEPLTAFEHAGEDRFEFGLDVIISGLAARAERT